MLALSFLFVLADILGGKFWYLRLLVYPMVVFGSNALLAYAGAILVKVHILQEWTVTVAGKKITLQKALQTALTEQYGAETGGWVYLIGYLTVIWFVCAVLYHRRLYVRA
jgi:predicted acyltransferase